MKCFIALTGQVEVLVLEIRMDVDLLNWSVMDPLMRIVILSL